MPTTRRAFWTAATLSLLLLPCFAGPLDAQEEARADTPAEQLGMVDFKVSCAPAVQEDFDRAVALLHHMMYQEARRAFESIAQRDPECAMAHWGIATSLFQPLWPARPSAEDRRRGWDAVQRARALEPGTERERALVDATAAFFQEPHADEWWPRIERWASAMDAAYRARPDDVETTAFQGLALLAAGQTAENRLEYNARAAELLAALHEREPQHPGAIHYTIHADDVSGRAHEHLDMVASYSDMAPSVPHSLHMPSHIYVRLGDWPGVIEWNRRSADAALERSDAERISFHHAHALDYLLYAHLQRGDDASAARVLAELGGDAGQRYDDGFNSAFHLAVMPARYALERRAWDEAARITPREPTYLAWDRYGWPEALSWFARGMGAAHTGDLATARQAADRMAEIRRAAEDAGEGSFATYIEVDRLILSGRIAHAEGDAATAIERTREAAELEQTVQKHPVTPGALLPPYEALGDLLMDLDRPGEALDAYESSLESCPLRYQSLLGAARAAREAGDEARARRHYSTLLDVVAPGSERAGLDEARAALTSDG